MFKLTGLEQVQRLTILLNLKFAIMEPLVLTANILILLVMHQMSLLVMSYGFIEVEQFLPLIDIGLV